MLRAARIFCLAIVGLGCGGSAPGGDDPDGGRGRFDATADIDAGSRPDAAWSTGSPVGAACSGFNECAGNYCIQDFEGFPDGYCTQLDCNTEAPLTACLPYGGDGVCLDISPDPGTPFGVCLDRCDPDASDCRDGYDCTSVLPGLAVCIPGGGGGGDPVGAACFDATQCLGDTCLTDLDGFPDGYCTQIECDVSSPEASCAPFGGDGVCVDAGDPGAPFGVCLDACDLAASDCRLGYECQSFGGWDVCLPGLGGVGTAPIGDPCAMDADCLGGTCLTPTSGYPGGYCSSLGCDPTIDGSCLPFGGDGTCIEPPGGIGTCMDTCTGAGDCRMGYTCLAYDPGTLICVPE